MTPYTTSPTAVIANVANIVPMMIPASSPDVNHIPATHTEERQ